MVMDCSTSSEMVRRVAEAVQVLNHDMNSCNRVAANQWLLQFQSSHSAWEVATSLLTTSSLPQNCNFEVHFFAAQILRRKIKSEGFYLQLGDKTALLNALLLASQRFSFGPSQLLTQICLALSSLMLTMGENEHKISIEQLFMNLKKLECQENGYIAVLELLTVLPEEATEDKIGSKSRFKSELLLYTPTVMEFLLKQSEQRKDDGLKCNERNKKIIRCLLSWVRADCFSDIQPNSLAQHPLLNFVFNSLQYSPSFDVAIDVMTELIIRYEGLPEIFLYRVQYIREYLLLPALASKNEKIIRGLAYLFSEIGQAAPALIAEGSKEALGLADALLSCVAFPSKYSDIADSTLPFWCSLAHYILGLEIKNGEKRAKLELFQPVFLSLLDALLLRAQGDEDDILDSLISFRANLEELLVDICQILGPPNFIMKLFSGAWPSTSSQLIPWSIVEARLFALYLVAETIVQAGQSFDFSVIIHLITILSNSKPEGQNGLSTLVYKTVAEVIGSYSEWLISILGHNLRQLLMFCASGIGELECSKSCTSTLRKLCEEASFIIHQPQNLEILFWVIKGLERSEIESEEEEEIIGAITLAFSYIPNKEIKKNSLFKLISPIYTAIKNLIDIDKDQSMRQNPSLYTITLNNAIRGLSRMGALFGHLTIPTIQENDDTNESLINILWPLLEKLFLCSHIENPNLSASLCRSLSLSINSSGQHFRVLLPKLLDCLSSNFLKYQNHDCYLRTVATCTKEFGHVEEYGRLFITTFERFNLANKILSLNSSYICDQEPELIEAYCSFTSTFVTSCPKEVIGSSGSLLEFSLQKAAICCTAMLSRAAFSAMSYISGLLDVCLNCMLEKQEGSLNTVMVHLISRSGEGIISNILYALLGVSAVPRVHKSATILQQLAALCRLCERTIYKFILSWDSLSLWLHSSVQALPSEYLKQGEAELLPPLWLNTLESAALDYLNCAAGTTDPQGGAHMKGRGGRTLKRVIRDFAESHISCCPPSN